MENNEDWLLEIMTKEVYAQFGKAYYYSECLHKGLCNLYALLGFRDSSDVTIPRFEEKLKEAYFSTLGQLIEKIKPILPDNLQKDLDQAVKYRNYLAHYFWSEQIHLMFSVSGLEELVSELSSIASFFIKIDQCIDEIFRSKLQGIGIDPSFIKVASDEIRSGQPVDPLPNKRFPRKQERIVKAWKLEKEDGSFVLIFESEDGSLWQLCDVGLGWSVYDKTDINWKIDEKLQKYLPALVNSRPQIEKPWNYELRFSTNVVLCVSKEEGERVFKLRIKYL